MTDSSPQLPRPASPSASSAGEATPAPAAADEATPLLVPSTETAHGDAPQAQRASRLLYILTVASLAFSIDTLVLGIATLIIFNGYSRYGPYLSWSVAEAQRGVATVAFFSLFISAVNLNRLRRKRPFVPLPINWIFDLGITFNAIALAVPGLGDVFEYRECWQMPEDEATCLRHALPVRILTGLMLATGLVIGVVHFILFCIRCRDAYRAKFWRQPWRLPTGEFTLQFTVKLLKEPQGEEGSV